MPDEDKNLLYTTFYDILNDLMAKKNLDIYVTGSNSRLLSKDVATNFRDRGCEIQVFPLSFGEFYEYSNLEKEVYEEIMRIGSIPVIIIDREGESVEKGSYESILSYEDIGEGILPVLVESYAQVAKSVIVYK